jgi:hypothetical protein
MWSAVEHSDYLSATQLYLFARHVHTSLTTSDVDGSLAATFPVIERQWAAVAHFNDAIYDGCQRALATPETEPVFFMFLDGIKIIVGGQSRKYLDGKPRFLKEIEIKLPPEGPGKKFFKISVIK